ncbi:tartrate dehydrogenase [Spiribacter insolitus]|uniref:D-malate dehydrogenase (decarboxylating) n=1 Tax=Spiribacter insolitus TaxID=3122417 RepID=A0ABV3T804_9GAMM
MTHRIALIPGDGIGLEVTPVGVRCLEALARRPGLDFAFTEFPYSCEYYAEHGAMMPEDGIEQLRPHDAILLGAVGYPGVPDHVSLWGLLLPIRREFQQYVNLRPVRLLRGLTSALRDRGPEDINYLVVRENNEGEYSEIGGRLYDGLPEAMAVQATVITRKGSERILDYAFRLAQSRSRKRLAYATKSNGIKHTMPFWDEQVAAMAPNWPDVQVDGYHVDILAANFVTHPDWFDVVVGTNLFGDILSDLGPATAGGIGVAPSANINPSPDMPSMFEPVHGSAPDIAGQDLANPIAMIWTVVMMLEDLGEQEAADDLMGALETVTAEGRVLTRDLGGQAGTREFADRVLAELKG